MDDDRSMLVGAPHRRSEPRMLASPEELLIVARRDLHMSATNGTTHNATPPPATSASIGTPAVLHEGETSRTWRERFATHDHDAAAALLEELAVGDAEIARELQRLERRVIAAMADELGTGALDDIQKTAATVRHRLTFTLKAASELREKNNNSAKNK